MAATERPTVLISRGSFPGEIQKLISSCGARARFLSPADDLRDAYERATHVLISGGADIDPDLYGAYPTWTQRIDPFRDRVESQLVTWALADGKPLMGICRGHQMITAVAGGTLYQDLARDAGIDHAQPGVHRIRLHPASRLGQTVGQLATVNSFHHQAVRNAPPGWRVVAESFDAVIEAIEHPALPVISVQWHPEALGDAASARLFAHFLSLSQ